MLSKLPLLNFISLLSCDVTEDHLSNIFKECTTLKEFQLSFSSDYDAFIKLPSRLKGFKIESDKPFEVDASLCTQLKSL